MSSQLRQFLPSGFFSSGLWTKVSHAFFFSNSSLNCTVRQFFKPKNIPDYGPCSRPSFELSAATPLDRSTSMIVNYLKYVWRINDEGNIT
jgi:hypothetical protein